MPDQRKTLIFPVEILSREFDSKLLLALCARERNWKVMIGNMAAINASVPRLPPCVYFSKSARSSNARLFALLKELGHDVVVLDEEVLVRQTDEIYLMKHERDALRNVDLVLTWGADSRELWERSGMADGVPVHDAGNPRIDMLLPSLRPYHRDAIESIRQRFGDFVLFNSNFGTVNNRVTGAERFNLAKWVDEKEVEAQAAGFLGHKRAIYEQFRLLMPKLAEAIAPRILLIRPHPAEDHAAWNEIAATHANVRVVFEGSVVPWIAAAKVLVHNGCTSAVEAAIAGTPVVSYRPVTSAKFDNGLPNSAGIECHSESEAISTVLKVLEHGAPPLSAQQTAMLHRFIAFDADHLSSDAICDAMDQHAIGRMADRKVALGTRLRIALKHRTKQFSRYLKGLKARDLKREDYRKLKFSGLTAEMANARIDVLKHTLGRFGTIRAHEVSKDILELR